MGWKPAFINRRSDDKGPPDIEDLFKNGRGLYELVGTYSKSSIEGKMQSWIIRKGEKGMTQWQKQRKEWEKNQKVKAKEKQRYSDNQVPVKTEEFTVYEEDGSVHAKFRATTHLDGSVEWKLRSADMWTPATVIDAKIQKRDNKE